MPTPHHASQSQVPQGACDCPHSPSLQPHSYCCRHPHICSLHPTLASTLMPGSSGGWELSSLHLGFDCLPWVTHCMDTLLMQLGCECPEPPALPHDALLPLFELWVPRVMNSTTDYPSTWTASSLAWEPALLPALPNGQSKEEQRPPSYLCII